MKKYGRLKALILTGGQTERDSFAQLQPHRAPHTRFILRSAPVGVAVKVLPAVSDYFGRACRSARAARANYTLARARLARTLAY